MTKWIDITLDISVWDQLQIYQRKDKRAKGEKWVVSPSSHTPILISELLKMCEGLWKNQGYRKLAGLFQVLFISPPLTSWYHVTCEGWSSETSLDNSKLSLANVLIITLISLELLVICGCAWEGRDKTVVSIICSYWWAGITCDESVLVPGMGIPSIWEDLECF